jgi:hypothetical protein
VLRFGGRTRWYSIDEMLRQSGVTMLKIPADVSCGRPMRYKAIPLAQLVAGLRALIRHPKSVRSRPGMRVQRFSERLPDGTLDAIVLYLKYKAAAP